MKPVYTDLHIHTTEDPNRFANKYDSDTLVMKIKEKAKGADFLISLTDHNAINKVAYLDIVNKVDNLLIGVELHVRKYKEADPYHCHIFFDINNISEEEIDKLNDKLDILYPKKLPNNEDVSIPSLEDIINQFDLYEFVLLPHGGQSHKTFDGAIAKGVKCDSSIERGLYYNEFDGFTARSNKGLEQTQAYFDRLGIREFVNLLTCSDNYNPSKYPEAKTADASPFIPTWMLASPSFSGLRLSLSESSRFVYSHEKPDNWSESIRSISLHNEHIDIDVNLTPGLNVVIGGSSSGKTLLVDSIYRKIKEDFSDSEYVSGDFDIRNIKIDNPTGVQPHYFYQNYMVKVVDNKNGDNKIDDIDIVKKVFPEDKVIKEEVTAGLQSLRKILAELIDSVKTIENVHNELSRIPKLSQLITTVAAKGNILKNLLPRTEVIDSIDYSKPNFTNHTKVLNDIDNLLKQNPFVEEKSSLIEEIKLELKKAHESSIYESIIRNIIQSEKNIIDSNLREENKEVQSKVQDFQGLLAQISRYVKAKKNFDKALYTISKYKIDCITKEKESMGHKLFIKNNFKLNKEEFLNVLNNCLNKPYQINSFKDIEPESLFKDNFKKRAPKLNDYDELETYINKSFEGLNKREYQIKTNDGRDFDKLSAGWKTSVLLDLILGYDGDPAPLIIDQPEDNLATKYINEGLIIAIKKIKTKKQIILVSHNATIPMLGDAQNVVLCENKENKITIKSGRLEDSISGKSTVDHIADITDGGKGSIKKRVKKYNLKKFK